jgi:hypothetical protein
MRSLFWRETRSMVDIATASQAALCGTVNQTRDIGFEQLNYS